jgi:hypothetical protein
MRKLNLDVSRLEVQSFTTDAGPRAAGTVEGYDDQRGTGRTRQASCPGFPCDTVDLTCPDTCGRSCDGGDTCFDTCHTMICACDLSDGGTCIC